MVTPTPNSLHRVPNPVHGVVDSVNSKRAVIEYSEIVTFQNVEEKSSPDTPHQ